MQTKIKAGQLVQLKNVKDSPYYEVVHVTGFACLIREYRFNGAPYANQRFDVSLLVPATFERGASFSKKQKLLSYWPSYNRSTIVDCDRLATAIATVHKSGVPQSLKMVLGFETSGRPISF